MRFKPKMEGAPASSYIPSFLQKAERLALSFITTSLFFTDQAVVIPEKIAGGCLL
jgi:hypothetical protein